MLKWQKQLIDKALMDTQTFLMRKYSLSQEAYNIMLNKVNLKYSSTCRFAKIVYSDPPTIRINLNRFNYVLLYDKKTIGNYDPEIRTIEHHAYSSQFIHEFTHLYLHINRLKQSEVETTKNEIEYLESKGYNILK